eukprot:2405769-Rhodomonas_salina.1
MGARSAIQHSTIRYDCTGPIRDPTTHTVQRYAMAVPYPQYHDTLWQYRTRSTTIRYGSTVPSVPRYTMAVPYPQSSQMATRGSVTKNPST